MKRCSIILFFNILSWVQFIFGQIPPIGGTPLSTSSNFSMVGKIIGRVYDDESKSPIAYASIVLLTIQKDSLVAGNLSDEKGYFSIENIPLNAYKLKISFVGYESFEKIVTLNSRTLTLETGDCFLKPAAVELNDVTISSEKQLIEFNPDKKILNVSKDLTAKGGTALDALKNAPGVTVNSDDEISLRNSTPTIYVDGKPSNLTMRQIPADAINTIEIITTPSAKYEASTTGGIINVTLKKNKKPGYNGLFNVGLGTNNQINGMSMLNVKEKKWGADISYNVNSGSNTGLGYTNRDNFESGNYSGGSYQDISTVFKRQFQFAKIDFNYFIDNRNTITLSETAVFGKVNIDESQATKELNSERVLILNSERVNLQDIHFTNYSNGLSFRHTYPKQDKELTADFTYSLNHGKNNYDYRTNSYDDAGNLLPENPEIQLIDVGSHANILTGQLDFTNPIGEKNKLELGFRGNWASSESRQNVNNYDYTLNAYEFDDILSNHYKTNEIVAGAYILYTGSSSKLTYELGLRLESSNFKTIYNDTGSYSYSYSSSINTINYALFPSVNLSYKLNNKQQFQFNASRKIARPNMFQSAPFVFASDKYNYRIGNPLLKPEFVNLVELNHNLNLEGFNLLTSLFGKYSEQPIVPYAYFADTSNQLLINSFDNANYSYSYGIEQTISISKIKNVNITLDGSYFYLYTGAIENKTTSNYGWTWDAKASVSYNFPKQFTLQLNGNYDAPKPISQGRVLAMYGMDASVKKEIGNLSINLTVSDIFNTRKMGIEYDTPSYYQIQSRRRDVRFARLSLSYQFGKMDASIFKMKKSKGDLPNLNSGDGY